MKQEDKLGEIYDEILELNSEVERYQEQINEKVRQAREIFSDSKIERDSIIDNICSYEAR